jgi:pyruvate/2-oxoglutarate dehydrogenase complex dihydrolipoamide dehydrogenase (E3) component
MTSILNSENVTILTGHSVSRVAGTGTSKIVFVRSASGERELVCDAILISTGKRANTELLNLDSAGVELDAGFVKVNPYQKTTAPNIWACGDVCKGYQFTHYADHQARVAIMNACLRLPVKREMRVVPWCTFSEPEIASVGLRESEAVSKFGRERVLVLRYDLNDFDRAILDDVASGFIKICLLKNGTIIGASAVAERAGELIHEFAIAMKKRMKIQELADMMHVYPTMSAAIGNCSAEYYKGIANDSLFAILLRMWVKLVR